MTIGSLFSGIGGLELGLEWAGLGPVVWQVEQSEFCRQVLARHWPDVERFDDVRNVGATELAPVDLICGGFPCQDVSSAGKGAGLAGSRSGLWSEFARIVDELGPRWVVVENVTSGAVRWVDEVVRQLGQLGYETLPVPLSAADVGAPHRRSRIFLVAHANSLGSETSEVRSSLEADKPAPWRWLPPSDIVAAGLPGFPVSPVCRVDDGVRDRSHRHRLRALGNAVVPQCAEVIGWVIRELSQ